MTQAGREQLALVAVGGWIGSGKSTVARTLADALSAALIVADEIRADHAGAGHDEAYVPGFSSVVYGDLLKRAGEELGAGRTAVLDGTFRTRALRSAARDVALTCGARFRFVECRAGEAACRERLRAREAAGAAGWTTMLAHFLTLWEDVDELPADEHVTLDTSGPRPLSLDASVLGLTPR